MRPCYCGRAVPGGPFVRGRDCGACWFWYNDPAVRATWEGRAGETPRIPAPRPPCRYEGPVVEACLGCGGDSMSVRLCLFDGHDAGRCTRGPNPGADADVASCQTCKHYEEPNGRPR